MIHLLGAILIAAASLLLSMAYIQEEKRKLAALCQLTALLKAMRGELSTRLTPLPEIAAALAQSSRGAALAFVSSLNAGLCQLGEYSFSEIWAKSAAKTLNILSPDERTAISDLGQSLGRYELEQQLLELDACIAYLNGRIAHSRTAMPEKRRLGLGLTWGAGALLVIILL